MQPVEVHTAASTPCGSHAAAPGATAPFHALVGIATTAFVCSLSLLGWQASYLYTPLQPPGLRAPPALGILIGTLACAFALESLWWTVSIRAGKPLGHALASGKLATISRHVCAAGMVGVSMLLIILYFVGFRPDAAMWTFALAAMFALIAYQVVRFSGLLSQGVPVPSSELGCSAAAAIAPSSDKGTYAPMLSDSTLVNAGTVTAVAPVDASIQLTAVAPESRPSRCAELRMCCLPPSDARCTSKALFCIHGCLWSLAVIFTILLLGGAGTIAAGWHMYPARGTFYSVALPDGTSQRVHTWCSGPSNASRPVMWLLGGGGGHSMSDLYGLRFSLNDAGWRVCGFDSPGTGWSPMTMKVDAASSTSCSSPANALVSAVIDAAGELGPYIVLGTQDDAAARAYCYALNHPSRVRALVPMQYGPPEFLTLAAYKGWGMDQTASAAAAAERSRLLLCDVIRFLGTSWGLVSIFAPPSATFQPANLQGESRFLNLFHEGQWDMQGRTVAAWANDPRNTVLQPDVWTANRTLAASIPVLALANFATASQMAAQCNKYSFSADYCAQMQFAMQQGMQFMGNMTTMTPSSKYLNCAESTMPGGQDPATVCSDWLGTGSTIDWVTTQVVAFAGTF